MNSYIPFTKTMIPFLKIHFPPTNDHLSSKKISNVSREKIGSLFQEIHDARQKWNIDKQKIMNQKVLSREIMKPTYDKYNYIPAEIREKIERDCAHQTHYSYSFTIHSRDFIIHFICTNEITHAHVLKKIERIYMWFQIACKQNPNIECSKNIHIYLYCIDMRKELPGPKELSGSKELPSEPEKIDMIHANTAFTTGCQTSTNIIIFREEEWFKVLMHESFHNLGLDFIELSSSDTKVLDDRLREMFHIEQISDIRLYETYCETWAEILNVLFIVYYMNIVNKKNHTYKNTKLSRKTIQNKTIQNKTIQKYLNLKNQNKSIQNMMKQFRQRMIYESIFSCFQCAKIMYYHQIHYADFIRTSNNTKIISPQYQENTYCFSYYVLKSVLLFHFPSFLDFSIDQNNSSGSDSIMKFMLTLENGNKYVDLIQQNYRDPIYMKYVSKMEKWLQTHSEKTIVNRTLRMTMFEI